MSKNKRFSLYSDDISPAEFRQQILDINSYQIQQNRKLPNIYQALYRYHNGEKGIFSKYFYPYRIINDNTTAKTYVRFWDYEINIMLKKLANKYNQNDVVVKSERLSGHKVGFVPRTIAIDDEEIISYFYDYLIDKILCKPFEYFRNVSSMRKYICANFPRYLSDKHNELIGIKKFKKNGKTQYTYVKPQIGYLEDLTVNKVDEDGNRLSYSDLLADPYGSPEDILFREKKYYPKDRQATIILKHYREILTKKQLEKFDKLVEYINKLDNDESGKLPRLFNFHKGGNRLTDNIFVKSTIARIILGTDRVIKNATKDVNQFLDGCRKRMDLALQKLGHEGLKFQIELPEIKKQEVPPVKVYTMSAEELKEYNQRYRSKQKEKIPRFDCAI